MKGSVACGIELPWRRRRTARADAIAPWIGSPLVDVSSMEGLGITAAETTFRGGMRYRPAEVDFGFNNLLLADRKNLGVAKPTATDVGALVRYEHFVPVGQNVDKVEPGNLLAVRPAALEVGLPIDAIVQWTGEVKSMIDQFFDSRPIFANISCIALLSNRC